MHVSTALGLATLSTAAAANVCGLNGPGFPAPSNLASDTLFKSIIQNITNGLEVRKSVRSGPRHERDQLLDRGL